LVTDRLVANVEPLHFSAMQCLVASAISLLAAFIFEDIQALDIVAAAFPILYTSVFTAGIGITLQMMGQRHVPPARSAVIFSFETVVAAIAAAIILSEFLDGRGYTGGGLILIGILVSQIQQKNLGEVRTDKLTPS